MGNLTLLLIIGSILFSAIVYIVRAKKSGVKCIGCPHGGSTQKKNDCQCGTTQIKID